MAANAGYGAGAIAVLRRLALVLAAAGVTACQTVPEPPDQALSWQARKALLSAIDTYEVQGRLSLTSPGGSEQASFTYRRSGDDLGLQLSGPLGIGAVRLDVQDGEGRLISARHGEVVLEDTEQDLTRLLGYPVPLSAIRYWAMGLPDPETAFARGLTDDGRCLALLDQGHWRVSYETYRTVAIDPQHPENTIELPRKVRLSGPDVSILMVFRRWQF